MSGVGRRVEVEGIKRIRPKKGLDGMAFNPKETERADDGYQ